VPSYLYGLILDRNAHLIPAHIPGIDGSTLRVIECGDLAALVSTVDRVQSRPSIDQVRAHDHALQAAVHHGATTVAVRFGQAFDSDSQLREDVFERGKPTKAVLERCDGCVEMRLLVALPDGEREATLPPANPASPGTSYLTNLGRENRASRDLANRLGLRAAIGPVVLAERVEALPKSRGAVFSHLIKRGEESRYRAAIALHSPLSEVKVVGPLALYAFAESSDE
jgi:hypothetical protein